MSREKRRRIESIRGWIVPFAIGAGIPLLASATGWFWLWYVWIAIGLVGLVYVSWVTLNKNRAGW